MLTKASLELYILSVESIGITINLRVPKPMTGKLIDRMPQLFYHQQNRYAQEQFHSSSPRYPRQPGHQM